MSDCCDVVLRVGGGLALNNRNDRFKRRIGDLGLAIRCDGNSGSEP
jgi:hypothetical protein